MATRFNEVGGISRFISAVNPLGDVYRGFDVTIARLTLSKIIAMVVNAA